MLSVRFVLFGKMGIVSFMGRKWRVRRIVRNFFRKIRNKILLTKFYIERALALLYIKLYKIVTIFERNFNTLMGVFVFKVVYNSSRN